MLNQVFSIYQQITNKINLNLDHYINDINNQAQP